MFKSKQALIIIGLLMSPLAQADEFTSEDTQRWQKQFMSSVSRGRELWTSGALGTNGVACAHVTPLSQYTPRNLS